MKLFTHAVAAGFRHGSLAAIRRLLRIMLGHYPAPHTNIITAATGAGHIGGIGGSTSSNDSVVGHAVVARAQVTHDHGSAAQHFAVSPVYRRHQ